MLKKCKITIHDTSILVCLKKTFTSRKIFEMSPCNSINKWSNEHYLNFDINFPLESDAKSIIEYGDIVFWPDGKCIAIEYGPTPISQAQKFRLISKCNIWRKANCNLYEFEKFSRQEKVKIERL
tara:strand:- start:885 stop:1256 length:372 start_codon:yes stop_codon:yes gene_type:complete